MGVWLAVLPVLHFVLLWIVTRREERTLLLHNYAIAYLDWLFVPFNILFLQSIVFSWSKFGLFFLLSLLVTILLHERWRAIKEKPIETRLFFNTTRMKPQGWIHFGFMCVQAALVLTAFFSTPISSSYQWMLGCLLVYFIGYVLFIRFVRKVRIMSKAEAPLVVLGLVVVSARLLFF